uniref:Zinc finger, CCHC-type n=1 Tax=Tanacetum cinerariifolium TaxID=118510 RepID=A0A6L2L735_TANCI|nr:hypothetical protein [Tanacetum cinerariifolium]
MLGSMSPELQRALENYKAYDMIQELKTMFEEQAKQEQFKTVKAFHACKQEDGRSVSPYFLKMKGYLDSLERLGCPIPKELGIQKDKKKPLVEKGKDKGNNNLAYALKPKIPPLPKRDNLAKESICHHCKEIGTFKKQEVETRSFKSVPGE